MYDHHRDFCRRNFMDPQQVWNEMVSRCWDAALHCRPCLVHACHLFDFKCSNSPRETDRIIHVLDILHVLSVLLVRDVAGKWHESCLCFPLWISLLYKMFNRIFVWQMPCRIFETLLGTKLIVVIPCWLMCTWCQRTVIPGHGLWYLVQNRFWQNNLLDCPNHFLTMSNMCHFHFQPVKPIMYESVVHFLKLKWCKII